MTKTTREQPVAGSGLELRAAYTSLSQHHGLMELDSRGLIVKANDKALELFGYTSEAQVIGMRFDSVGQVDGAPGQSPRTVQVSGPAGSRSVECHFSAITDVLGEATKDIVLCIESTGRGAAGPNDNDALMEAVSDSQAVIEFKPDGTIVQANPNFCGAVGYQLSEIQGRHHRMFVDPAEAADPSYEAFWQALRRGERQGGEFRRIGKGGKEVYIQADYCPIKDAQGQVVKVVKFASEITEAVLVRKRAVRAEALVSNNPNAIMVLDPESFEITYINQTTIDTLRGIEHLLPCRVDDLVGQCVDIFHKDPMRIRRLLSDPRNLPHRGIVALGPEWLELKAFAVYDENGKYTASAVSWDVVTERKNMELRDQAAKEAVSQVQMVLDQLSKGIVDTEIVEDFNDDGLNSMRDNVNTISSVLRGFLKEVGELSDAARRGDLGVRANPAEFSGSFRTVVTGMNDMVEALLDPFNAIQDALSSVAKGDLTAYIQQEYHGDYRKLQGALHASLDGLNALLTQVSSSSAHIARSSSEVASSAQSLSQGASEQAASVEEISSQIAQITAQTRTNAENATEASSLATKARDGAQSGDQQMTQMVEAMRGIEEASNSISKIIKVIDEIAFQTNLLALNAAVEAARAGVHGRGFAVVAEEVRNLAARSASAAKETTELIEGTIERVASGTAIASKTAEALSGIVSDVGQVTQLVAQIAAASNEQADAITQTKVGLDQINTVTQRNTATAEESAAASHEMLTQVESMERKLQTFTLKSEDAPAMGGDIPPELFAAFQAFMASNGQAMPGTAPNAGNRPNGARASSNGQMTQGPRSDEAPQIALDASEFGKY